MSAAAPKLFISYRREETAGHAGRLYDAVATRFGADNVFMDVELAPGIDFVERITRAVGDCHTLLVVIGPRWASVRAPDGGGLARLAEADDYVRLEVETALRRADVRVIPVLVAGAQMPQPEQLPESLRALARRNAIELSDGRWRFDVGRLVDALDDEAGDARPAPAPAPLRVPSGALLLIEGALVTACAALLAHRVAVSVTDALDLDRDPATVVRRALNWGLLAAAVAAWLRLRVGGRGSVAGAVALGALAGAAGGALDAVLWLWVMEPSAGALRDDVARVAVGLLLGGLLGALWSPPRVVFGALAGACAAFLAQALLNTVWALDPGASASDARDYTFVTLQAVAVVAAALALLLWLAARRAPVSRPPR
ncbi:toll/interleukin-1 receptor domain-containing protein [Conexibacter stalactiti]|uniref:Toll/interleukin-1 receptor domain-containing protein n=1 Tax=Conexibacter stalactiti TaxID=1940611 RepID=A0ABU4HJR5_9ACTN|nr:toll/interleukin-1 receptor domain-containing protein [Conexibacter stalactiti]MDW5592927.1 toll/interleukin-1 receptor domain-containing protein [Conexibacter stalactiti]MEC5033568.1 toll/interleukin-1 receptor domain-containing protein [Conexibacter stalactiti]